MGVRTPHQLSPAFSDRGRASAQGLAMTCRAFLSPPKWPPFRRACHAVLLDGLSVHCCGPDVLSLPGLQYPRRGPLQGTGAARLRSADAGGSSSYRLPTTPRRPHPAHDEFSGDGSRAENMVLPAAASYLGHAERWRWRGQHRPGTPPRTIAAGGTRCVSPLRVCLPRRLAQRRVERARRELGLKLLRP